MLIFTLSIIENLNDNIINDVTKWETENKKYYCYLSNSGKSHMKKYGHSNNKSALLLFSK